MKYLIFCTVLIISGCTSLEGWQFERASNICKDRGGVDYIEYIPLNPKVVNCNDGTWFSLKQEAGKQ